jgi:hypothetical protein
MTVHEEGQRLRAEVGRLARGQGHKYPAELRGRILAWVERARASGMTEGACGTELGLKPHRFDYWRKMAQRDAAEPRALVRVGVHEPPVLCGAGLSFATPSGFRLEGLTMEQAIALLQVFA